MNSELFHQLDSYCISNISELEVLMQGVGVFNNAESVIQFTDKESGNITGKYFLSKVVASSQYSQGVNAYALINIQAKDGASKIIITPEEFQYMKGNMFTLYNEEVAKKKINTLISDFESSIRVEDDKNW
jgi:hypothetical protein